jgi:hypothetical protein
MARSADSLPAPSTSTTMLPPGKVNEKGNGFIFYPRSKKISPFFKFPGIGYTRNTHEN